MEVITMAKLEIDKFVQEMTMKATENIDDFIFEVIGPYCEEVSRMTISKEYLKQILQKVRWKNDQRASNQLFIFKRYEQ